MGGEALRRRNRSSRSSFPAEQSAKKKARETRKDEKCTRTVASLSPLLG